MKNLIIIENKKSDVHVLRHLLSNTDYEICACKPHTSRNVRQVKALRPNLVLLGLDDTDLLSAFADVRDIQQQLFTPVILMSSTADAKTLRQVQASGSLLINKPLRYDDVHTSLFLALDQGARGTNEVFFHKNNKCTVLHMADSLQKAYSLTPAEVRVAQALLEEPEVGKVAQLLNLSTHTIRSHLKRLYAKTGTNGQMRLLRELVSGPASQYIVEHQRKSNTHHHR
ncbi:MAG: helix-turn-helix transcriptional regulator [Candidatus Eutrophobiaceae bacterium]